MTREWGYSMEGDWAADSQAKRRDGVRFDYEISIDENGVFTVGGTAIKVGKPLAVAGFLGLIEAKEWCQNREDRICQCLEVADLFNSWEPEA